MKAETFIVGIMAENCCLLSDDESGSVLIVDPGAPSEELNEKIASIDEGKIKYILLTHGHFDHIGYAADIREKTGARIVIYDGEEKFLTNSALNLSAFMGKVQIQPFSADIIVHDGETLPFGNKEIKVIHTPGHTSGSCCYIVGDIIFSGDTLMAGSAGRTDFPTGDIKKMTESLKRIKNLEGDYKVYCGHGASTTLNEERENNYYVINS